jgi:hypothetical protein
LSLPDPHSRVPNSPFGPGDVSMFSQVAKSAAS